MTNYQIKLTDAKYSEVEIVPQLWNSCFPDTEQFIHFAHHDFDIVWNPETKRQDVVRGQHTYYGGMGEGQTFKTWQDAIHASLYDLFQVNDNLHEGDTFTVTYNSETTKFRCESIHVVKES